MIKLAATRRTFTTQRAKTLTFTALGFGTAPLGNYLRALDEKDCDATIRAAWDSGMRHFDTAPLYGLGLSEVRLSRVLKNYPRNEYVISTKVGRLLIPCPPEEDHGGGVYVKTLPNRFEYDYSYDAVMKSYESSLRRLGLNRVDILYVHDIDGRSHGGREGSEKRIAELMKSGGWRALDELRASGAVAAIGAGVNEWEPCARLLELTDPDLFLLAGRYTLLEQEPLEKLFPECARRKVGIVIGGPYNSGVLAGQSTYDYAAVPERVVSRVREIEAVCRAHDVELPRAALQFVTAHPIVVSVIPGGQSPSEVTQNAGMLTRSIPNALWRDLKTQGLLHKDAPTPDWGR